jgi:hypothetical protein
MKALSRRIIFVSILAMLLVSISVTTVFAQGSVPGSNVRNRDSGLESKWKREVNTLQRYKFLDNQIPKWISVWRKAHPFSRLARAKKNMYANEANLAVRQAEILIANHPGFDANGKVINQVQAAQSVRTLASYLQELRTIFRHKFHHIPRRKH